MSKYITLSLWTFFKNLAKLGSKIVYYAYFFILKIFFFTYKEKFGTFKIEAKFQI